jgi:hypothetical protein
MFKLLVDIRGEQKNRKTGKKINEKTEPKKKTD